MSKENNTVELKDEELEKVAGGDTSNQYYCSKCKIHFSSSVDYRNHKLKYHITDPDEN